MNKILHQVRIFILLPLFIFNFSLSIAQNKYGLTVITNKDSYKRSIAQDSAKKMVELKSLALMSSTILRYATTNNFMNRKMYSGNIRHSFFTKTCCRNRG
jgi:hypothetical protein